MKRILMMISFLFLFSGCSQKEIIIKKELVCIEQTKVPRVEAEIRIHKKDLEVAKAYKESKDSAFRFYENQVDRNNERCEGVEDAK